MKRKTKYHKVFCLDCEKLLSKNACYCNYERCPSCAKKYFLKDPTKNPMWKGGGSKLICPQCKKSFISKRHLSKKTNKHYFCSKECRLKWYSNYFKGKNNPNWKGGKIKVKCSYCKKIVLVTGYALKKLKHYFCDRECFHNWQRIQPKKIVKVFCKCGKEKSKNSKTCKDCYNKYRPKGKKVIFTKEHCKKISESRIRRGVAKKEKNPNWKNFVVKSNLYKIIRNLEEYREWRRLIFKRDDYTCQKCGVRGGKFLEIHHIEPFIIIFNDFLKTYSQFSPIEDKETLVRLAMTYAPFWDVDNGEVLCQNCHKKTKKLNQYSVNNRKEE